MFLSTGFFGLKRSKNFYLPISITRITNIELIKYTQNHSLNETVNIATKELSEELEKEIPNIENIVDKKIETIEGEKSVIVTLKYIISEEIGEYKKN